MDGVANDPAIQLLLDTLKSSLHTIGDKYLLPAAGSICVVVIIWGGIQYMTGGSKGEETGKKTIIAAIIGLIIIILSYVIITSVTTIIP